MDYDHKRLLIKAARLYYEHDMTQAEIAEQLRLSRQKTQRILEQAREDGVVSITIHPIMEIFWTWSRLWKSASVSLKRWLWKPAIRIIRTRLRGKWAPEPQII